MNDQPDQSGSREKEIFLTALEKAPDKERADYLKEACGNDPQLRAAVEALLQNHLADGFLEQPVTLIDSAAEEERRRVASARDAFAAGELFASRYRIVGLLGEGGMGKVYRADDLKLGQSVALKFLPPALADDPVWLLRFRNEVRIAREVAHPNVCRVYDIGEAEGEHFISMEFVDGEDISSLLRRIGRLQQDKAVEIARQLCAGLSAAHARGVVHRDLKPANIMIDGRGKVRITDFGIAALAGQVQGKEVRAGTPSYMAPEQLAGTEVTIRSDIYALGLVLYEIFTGKKAIEGASITQVQRVQSRGSPATPASHVRDLDPQVERIILRCLEPYPKNRPRSAMAVAAALPGADLLAEAIASGDTPSPELLAEAGESGTLRPWVAVACWVCVLAAVAGSVAMNDRSSLFKVIPPVKQPEVLVERAEQIMERLGYTNAPADRAFWYSRIREASTYLTNITVAADRLKQLATGRPATLVFRYRSAAGPMKPMNSEARVTDNDPPFKWAGMRRVTLDPQGRLIGFTVIPPSNYEPSESVKAFDWSLPFREAGIELTNFTPVAVNQAPEVHCDQVLAWTAPYPNWPGETLRVEAGSLSGMPVFFWLIQPWRKAPSNEGGPAGSEYSFLAKVIDAVFGVLIFGVFATAAYLARRNLITGRGDRAGARRIGLFVVVVSMSFYVLRAHSLNEWNSVQTAFLSKIGFGFLAWLFYLAIEPYARRYWPHTLVSWSRLLSGRVRDPSVGRDLLIGCLAGMLLASLEILNYAAASWSGEPPEPHLPGDLALLLGGRYLAAHLFDALDRLVVILGIFLFLLLARLALRRDWLVMMVVMAFLGLAIAADSQGASFWDWLFILILFLFLVVVPIRLGLLAFCAMMSCMNLVSRSPATFDFSVWWTSAGWVGPILIVALATYGCWVSMGAKPLLKDEMLTRTP